MSAKSKKQWRYIQYLRNKYGSKSEAPEKYKWAFDSDWTDVDYKSLPEHCNKLKKYISIYAG